MYAIIEDGARQYRVSEGDVVRVDFRAGDGDGAEKGTAVEFGRVLLYGNGADVQIGRPVVAGARVVGEVVDHPSVKVDIGKFRRRKNYRRFRGHRQFHTAVRIRHILLAGQNPPPPTEHQAPAPQAPQAEAPAPAAS